MANFYSDYLKSREWRVVRRLALARAGKRCQAASCKTRRRLTVHHLTYERLGHESLSDVIVLCWRHHDTLHRLQRDFPTVSHRDPPPERRRHKTRDFIEAERRKIGLPRTR